MGAFTLEGFRDGSIGQGMPRNVAPMFGLVRIHTGFVRTKLPGQRLAVTQSAHLVVVLP